MEKEIDGGVFSEIKKEELRKQTNNNNGQKENENQFITGEPSMITTDEVFALLGEQMVKAKNWSKIALAWNKNFIALNKVITQRELQIASLNKENQGLKDSNSKYVLTNQNLDKRITELNLQSKEKDNKLYLCEKSYSELERKYDSLVGQEENRKNKILNLTKDNDKLIGVIKEFEREQDILKEKLSAKGKKAKKPKA